VALLGQVVGDGQTGRPGADHGRLPAGRRQVFRELAPEAGIVVGGDPFQAADRQRAVELAAPAGGFTHREAGAADDSGEGQLLPHHGDGFAIAPGGS
jgi:hypothetical protein